MPQKIVQQPLSKRYSVPKGFRNNATPPTKKTTTTKNKSLRFSAFLRWVVSLWQKFLQVRPGKDFRPERPHCVLEKPELDLLSRYKMEELPEYCTCLILAVLTVFQNLFLSVVKCYLNSSHFTICLKGFFILPIKLFVHEFDRGSPY